MFQAAPSGAAAAGSKEGQPAAASQGRKHAADGGEQRVKQIKGEADDTRKLPKKVEDKKKKAATFSKDHSALVKTMVIALLKLCQSSRAVESVVFVTFLIPAAASAITMAREQTKKYSEATKGVRGHSYGPPHTYAFAGFINGILTEEMNIAQELILHIRDFVSVYEGWNWEQRASVITYCRLDKTWTSGTVRLTLAVSPWYEKGKLLLEAVAAAVQAIDGIPKFGRAPPSFVERELQEWAEAFVKS